MSEFEFEITKYFADEFGCEPSDLHGLKEDSCDLAKYFSFFRKGINKGMQCSDKISRVKIQELEAKLRSAEIILKMCNQDIYTETKEGCSVKYDIDINEAITEYFKENPEEK